MQTTWYPALHTFSEYRQAAPSEGLPRSLEVAERHCMLPLSATMDEGDIDAVVETVQSCVSRV